MIKLDHVRPRVVSPLYKLRNLLTMSKIDK